MSPTDSSADLRSCGGDVAAYALGALEPEEAETFRIHLETCVVCRDELAAFRNVVDVLPMSAPQHAAPPRLRRRVISTVKKEARRERRADPGAGRMPLFARLPVPRPVLAAAATVAILAVAAAGIELGNTGSSTSRTRVYQAHVIGATGTAKVTVTDGRAQLIVHHFSPPPAGKIYEVWMQRGTQAPAPTGALFSVTGSGDGDVAVPGSLRGVDQLMVTPEPTGGSSVPTHAPVIQVRL